MGQGMMANKLLSLVIIVAIGVLNAACTREELRMKQQGADVHLDNADTDSIKKRQEASLKNLNEILGTSNKKLSDKLGNDYPPATALRLGYTAIDRQCNIYFNYLLHVQRGKIVSSSQVSIVGTALSSIFALADVGTKAAGITAASTGLGVATIENIGSGLLYQLDAGATHVLTARAMATYRNSDAARSEFVATYGDVLAILSGYALLCTPPQIESLVKSAIEKSEPEEKTPSEKVDPQRAGIDAAVNKLLGETQKRAALSSLTVGEAQILYALFVSGNGAALKPENANIRKALKTKLNEINTKLASEIFEENGSVKQSLISSQLTNGLWAIGKVDEKSFTPKADSIHEDAKKTPDTTGAGAASASPAPATPPPSATPLLPGFIQ